MLCFGFCSVVCREMLAAIPDNPLACLLLNRWEFADEDDGVELEEEEGFSFKDDCCTDIGEGGVYFLHLSIYR